MLTKKKKQKVSLDARYGQDMTCTVKKQLALRFENEDMTFE